MLQLIVIASNGTLTQLPNVIVPVMAPTAYASDTTAREPPNIMALLASALNLVGDNDTIKDLVAEALNASASL